MQKKLYSVIAASVLIASSGQAKSLTEQRKDQLEQETLVVQQSLNDLRIKIAELTSLATKLEPTLQADAIKACKEEISRMIDEFLKHYDPSRPEPNLLKILLEVLLPGYQRPTGSLTPQAFRALDLWLHDLTDWELRQALVIVKEKIKDNRASHINSFYAGDQELSAGKLTEMKAHLHDLEITNEEIEQYKALKIIRAQIWFELDKREEDEE